LPNDLPVTLTIVEDPDLLRSYNDNNYGSESFRHARYLSPDRYRIDDFKLQIPRGERKGTMRIRIRPNGLSPDSMYLIPFRVTQCSEYEMNDARNTVLYRIRFQNPYSTTVSVPQFTHRGVKTTVGSDVEQATMAQKHVHAVSANEVRIIAGNTVFKNDLNFIEKWSLRLKMDADGKVTISPWNLGTYGMKVTQIDDDELYPNTYGVIKDDWGRVFKTFMLCYEYVDADSKVAYRMQEELRIEFRPEVK
jgi:hypothetical protein